MKKKLISINESLIYSFIYYTNASDWVARRKAYDIKITFISEICGSSACKAILLSFHFSHEKDTEKKSQKINK